MRTAQRVMAAVQYPEAFKPGLKPSTVDCSTIPRTPGTPPSGPCASTGEQRYGVMLQRGSGPMEALIIRIVQPDLKKLVVDATGLTGNFAWEIAFTRSADAQNVFPALEDQLGLRLVETTAPYEVLVIDALHEPTPN